MAGIRNRIADILVKSGVIDDLQLRSALARHDQWGGRLTRVISDMALAEEDAVTDALSRGLSVPRIRLGHLTKDASALAKVDVTYAEEKSIFPVQLKDGGKTLVVAMADPTDLQCIDQVAAKARVRVQVMLAGDREIQAAIQRYYRGVETQAPRMHVPRMQEVDPSVASDDDDEEGKIVDMSGKTLFKHIKDILGDEAPPPIDKSPTSPGFALAPETAEPPRRQTPSETSRATADLLDEILGTRPKEEFTPDELQRIDALHANQEKSTRILRAVLELCLEKGKLKQGELAARIPRG